MKFDTKATLMAIETATALLEAAVMLAAGMSGLAFVVLYCI